MNERLTLPSMQGSTLKPMKILKQKILFLLYFAQSFGQFGRWKKKAQYLSYNFLYLLLPNFGQASIRKAVGELVRGGEIDKIIRSRKVFLRLAFLGEGKIRNLFVNFFTQQVKSEGWFLGIIRSGQDTREIRGNLWQKGFIGLKKGVYLKPAKREFIHQLGELTGKVFFIFTKRLEFFDEKQLVGQLWQVDRHYRIGANLVRQAKTLLNKLKLKKRLSKKEINLISALSDNFFVLIKNTIRLSKNLLPDDWPLLKAAGIYAKILKRVEV